MTIILFVIERFIDLPFEDSFGRQPQRIIPIELHEEIGSIQMSQKLLLLNFLFALFLLLIFNSILFELDLKYLFNRLDHLLLISIFIIRIINETLVVESDIDDQHSVDFSGERFEVKISDILNFENDVSGKVEALYSLIIDPSVGLMNFSHELFIFRRIDALVNPLSPLAFKLIIFVFTLHPK